MLTLNSYQNSCETSTKKNYTHQSQNQKQSTRSNSTIFLRDFQKRNSSSTHKIRNESTKTISYQLQQICNKWKKKQKNTWISSWFSLATLRFMVKRRKTRGKFFSRMRAKFWKERIWMWMIFQSQNNKYFYINFFLNGIWAGKPEYLQASPSPHYDPWWKEEENERK